jgi:putative metallohydrolase (TIGR04338 family)
VYDAEERLKAKDGPEFTWAETLAYVERVTRSRWWRCRLPRGVRVKDGRGTRIARGGWGTGRPTVNLPRWARTRLVILHELAHVLTSRPGREVAAHGPEFAKTYLELVRRFEPELAPRLRAEFKAGRVRTRVAKPQPVRYD